MKRLAEELGRGLATVEMLAWILLPAEQQTSGGLHGESAAARSTRPGYDVSGQISQKVIQSSNTRLCVHALNALNACANAVK